MKTIVLLIVLSATFMYEPYLEAQQEQQPQEQPAPPQQPPPQPPPEPQVTGRAPEPSLPDIFDRERAERARDIERMLDAFGLDSTDSRRTSRQISQPHFAPVMKHDSEFALQSIPLMEWLRAKDVAELPWKIEIKDPALGIYQRLEVAYTAKIQARQLNRLGTTHELFFVIGVSNIEGEWLVEPKVVRQSVKTALPNGVELWFSDWVFAKPGNYVLWFALYDSLTGKHNVAQRRVQVPQPEHDAFPNASDRLPQVELPHLSDREGGTIFGFYTGLTLPVRNKQELRVELMPILSPPEQWAGEVSVVRDHNEQTAAAVNTLSQMQLTHGSISMTGLDVVRHAVPLQQKGLSQIDWRGFLDALQGSNSSTITAETLQQSKSSGAFFRNSVHENLNDSQEAFRVLIVISSPIVFQHGSDLQPLKPQADCRCRIYHLRFRHNAKDVFDDIEKLLKPLHPKTFNVITASDMRKALAEIIHDLEQL